jgi:predicted AlkP superfamily phosphohydrolase/phosphomutase
MPVWRRFGPSDTIGPMRILVLGLDCADPSLLFGNDDLPNLNRLMAQGCYGRLESINPPITVPAWASFATGLDPGCLGVYGFRNRADRSYDKLNMVTSASITKPAIWDTVAAQGGRANIVGVPPNYPVVEQSGVSIGCFLTPDARRHEFVAPRELRGDIERLVGDYPVDVMNFRTHDKARLLREIYSLSRRQWDVVRWLARSTDWDYFHFVEIGLDRLQHGFWKFHDPRHILHEPGHPHGSVVRDYYRYLDHQIGSVLDLLDEETAVLVLSDHGAQPLDGGFCVNEWLVHEGLLTLDSYPREVTALSQLSVDWSRTTAWSEGGYYARVFLNVRGREPQGTIAPGDYERVRDDLATRFENTVDPRGLPLGTRVYRPEEIYRQVRGLPPDLIVHFGDLRWRSIGSVGHAAIHSAGNDTGPDDCNHSPFGGFVLSAPGVEQGWVEGARLVELAPRLLEIAGYDLPATSYRHDNMVGRFAYRRPSEVTEPSAKTRSWASR